MIRPYIILKEEVFHDEKEEGKARIMVLFVFHLAASILVERLRGGMELGTLAGRGFTRTNGTIFIIIH